jgi:peptidoglycan/LPS O-acetylase OafA/YrhL
MRGMVMRTIDACLVSRRNNFDVLRLGAALLVLWAHSYPLIGKGADDIFAKLIGHYDSGGGLGVTTFFAISGFLVTKSVFERSPADYVAARLLRILPGLAFAVLATVLVIGPVLTKMPLVDYFRDPSTLSYFRNILVFGVQFDLADTTATLPYRQINGSLWTLAVECGLYTILVLLARFHVYQRRTAPLWIAVSVGAFAWGQYVLGLGWPNVGPTLWTGAPLYWVLKYGLAFTLGSSFWMYRERIPLDVGLVVACLVALVAACGTASGPLVYLLCVPYIVIYLALGLPRNFSLADGIGDLSYGVYLIAFPMQQLTIATVGSQSATVVSLIATALSLAFATASWRFVEKPCLMLKNGKRNASWRISWPALPRLGWPTHVRLHSPDR